MRAEDLRELLDVKPFVPIRLHLSDGKYYDIRHPELVLLARTVMDIGVARRVNGRVVDKIVRVALLHVVRAEPVSERFTRAS